MTYFYNYILDDNGDPVPEPDMQKWARWVSSLNNRRVELTQVDDVVVSTVFLGSDHRYFGDGPPILWETMVFGGRHDQEHERYTSLADAKAGHARWVAAVSC